MRKAVIVLSIFAGVAVVVLAASTLTGSLIGAITGTTTDPRSLGHVRSANMAPVRATLKTDILIDDRSGDGSGNVKGDYRLTFEAPAAYYTAIGRPSRDRGIQAVGFAFWSQTGDPVAPDIIEQRRLCRQPDGRLADSCPEDPIRKRQEAGEWQVEFEMFNAVDTPREKASINLGALERARASSEACLVYRDANLDMTVVTVPEADYPTRQNVPASLPNFCGGAYIVKGERALRRGETEVQYYPPRVFYKFHADGRLRYRVTCRAFGSQLCTMRIDLGSWGGRAHVHGSEAPRWDKTHNEIMNFLSRHVVSQTIR